MSRAYQYTTEEQYRQAVRLQAKGVSCHKIAKLLGIARGTVNGLLRRGYAGCERSKRMRRSKPTSEDLQYVAPTWCPKCRATINILPCVACRARAAKRERVAV